MAIKKLNEYTAEQQKFLRIVFRLGEKTFGIKVSRATRRFLARAYFPND